MKHDHRRPPHRHHHRGDHLRQRDAGVPRLSDRRRKISDRGPHARALWPGEAHQDQAMRCARDGFAVLAPNFFFRHPDQKVLNAGNSRYDITDPESVELIKAALATVKNHKAADPSKVVVCGYCQTGRHPLVFAAEVPISAAVVWYGARVEARMGGQQAAAEAARRRHRQARLPGVRAPSARPTTSSRSTTCGASATASRSTRRTTTSTSTRARRTAGSTTPCRAATARRRPTPAGPRSSAFCPEVFSGGYDRDNDALALRVRQPPEL